MPAVEGDATDGESVNDENREEDGKENSVGDRGREREEEKIEAISSLAMSKCSEIAVVAEYDVIDLCVKPYLTGHAPLKPLRGAGRTRTRAIKEDEPDMHHYREVKVSVDKDEYNDAGRDGKKRVKINEELNRSEKDSRIIQYVNKERDRKRDRDRDRMSLKEGEKVREKEGEREEEGGGGNKHPASAVIGSRPRSRSLSSLDSSKKRFNLHSSPLSALCSADHVRHHTAYR